MRTKKDYRLNNKLGGGASLRFPFLRKEESMKKKKESSGSTIYHGCVANNSVPPANEHTVKAVEAMARAAEANANAIAKIAEAMKGGNATMQYGFHCGAPKL